MYRCVAGDLGDIRLVCKIFAVVAVIIAAGADSCSRYDIVHDIIRQNIRICRCRRNRYALPCYSLFLVNESRCFAVGIHAGIRITLTVPSEKAIGKRIYIHRGITIYLCALMHLREQDVLAEILNAVYIRKRRCHAGVGVVVGNAEIVQAAFDAARDGFQKKSGNGRVAELSFKHEPADNNEF